VAKTVGVSHPHVAAVRAELEKSGDVETVTTSIDTKGRAQPARKAAKKHRETEDRKRVRMTAAKDANPPKLALQQTDFVVQAATAVQRILQAIEKLDDQQLAELKAALMQQWSVGLGAPSENARQASLT